MLDITQIAFVFASYVSFIEESIDNELEINVDEYWNYSWILYLDWMDTL
jgi:hypothetical protein